MGSKDSESNAFLLELMDRLEMVGHTLQHTHCVIDLMADQLAVVMVECR